METIQKLLEYILTQRYGKDVRQAIHDAIKKCYDDGKAGVITQQMVDDIANIKDYINDVENDKNILIVWHGDTSDLEKYGDHYKMSDLSCTVDELQKAIIYWRIKTVESETYIEKEPDCLVRIDDNTYQIIVNCGDIQATVATIILNDTSENSAGIYLLPDTEEVGLDGILILRSPRLLSWGELRAKPFDETAEMLFVWDGDTTDLESVTVTMNDGGADTDIPLYKVSDTPLTLEQIVGSTVSGYEAGTAFTITVEESNLTITDTMISSGVVMHSVLADTMIGDVTLTTGLWCMKFSQTYVTKIIKETVKQLDAKFVDSYTKAEIDAMFDSYVADVAALVGGDA